MMKNLNKMKRMLIAAVILPLTSLAQIQDGGFENWDSVPFFSTGKNFLPKGWYEINNEMSNSEQSEWSVTRTNDAYKGNYAIKLKNVLNSVPQNALLMTRSDNENEIDNKIPVSGKPMRLDFYYKFFSPDVDTFTASVYMVKAGDIVGIGTVSKSTQKSDYTKLSVPIMYTLGTNIQPDSAIIMFQLGGDEGFVEGTQLIIDEVAFGFSTGLYEKSSLMHVDVNIWPNPATNHVNIEITGADKQVTIELINALGETVQHKKETTQNGNASTVFDLSALQAGIYFVKISDNNGSKGFRLLHE